MKQLLVIAALVAMPRWGTNVYPESQDQRPNDLEVDALVTGSADAHPTPSDTALVEATGEYDLDFALPTVAGLSTSITANSTTVSNPDFCHNLADGTADDLAAYGGYGDTLTKAEGGTDFTTLATSTFGLSSAVNFNAGDYYHNSTATDDTGELLGHDAVFEFVFQGRIGIGSEIIAAKRVSAGKGWFAYINSVSAFAFSIHDGGSSTVPVSSNNSITEGAWHHVMVFLDRSGNAAIYINGIADGTANIAGENISIDSDEELAIGADSDGGAPYAESVAWVCMWKQSAWLSAGDATTALRRAHQAMGIVKGGSSLTASAESWTRGSSAWVDVGGEYVQTGDNWMRNGAKGFVVEERVVSETVHSDFSSGWTERDAGDTTTPNNADGPMGASTATTLVADTTDGLHGLEQLIATDTGVVHSFSMFAKPGNQNYVRIAETGDGENLLAYFDIQNCAVGTTEGTLLYTIAEPANNGWCRVGITAESNSTANRKYFALSATDDNDATFAGDGSTINTYISNYQVTETYLHLNPSPGGVTGISVLADVVDIDFASAITPTQIRTTVQAPYAITTCCNAGSNFLFAMSDSGSTTESIRHYIQVAGKLVTDSAQAVGDTFLVQEVTAGLLDGAAHLTKTTIATDDVKLFVDDGGTAVATDTTHDTASNLDAVQVGSRADNNADTYGNFRIQKISIDD
jgi:hypothetical protein